MNILVITHCFPANNDDFRGVFFPDFLEELHNLGHNVFVLTQDKPLEKEKRPYNVIWFPWSGGSTPLGHLSLKRPGDYFAYYSLMRNGEQYALDIVRKEKIDYCLAMWAFPAGAFARKIKKRLGVPYAVWALGFDIWTLAKIPLVKNVIKRILDDADDLFADGTNLISAVEKMTGKECKFLRTSRKLPESTNVSPKLIDGVSNLLFIGRLEKVKGVDTLLFAFAKLLEMGERLHLHIFGCGLEEDALKKIAADLRLDRNVTFHGIADPETAKAYLMACDCHVTPSRMDTFPITVVDGLNSDIPVVVSDVGDMESLIAEYKAGLVFPVDDVSALVERIKEAISDPRDKYSEGRKRLVKLFDYSLISKQFISEISKDI